MSYSRHKFVYKAAIASLTISFFIITKISALDPQSLNGGPVNYSEQGEWNACMPDNNSFGSKATPIEYARMIEPELGVIPIIDCGEGVEIPIYVDDRKFIGNPGLHNCDNPSLQIGDCMSGSSLQRFGGQRADGTALPHVVWVSFCRHDGRDTEVYDMPDSVQLIGYN
ncbi:MAG TPA: hypothetical protein DCF95_09855, partial [Gammaproteobacteria bacterium]|nr:hypothetical protein [Gammaproteobacteria bacterium]